jgi:16S rRNA (guanine527-N7)-methyltransferase
VHEHGPPAGGDADDDLVIGISRRLGPVLDAGRTAGTVGPASDADHIRHALRFAAAVPEPVRFADIGSGGGLPGLVLALRWTTAEGVLVESNHRRAAALAEALVGLGLEDRITVRMARVEDVGRDSTTRGRFPVVTARSFGPPAVTAECGAPLLAPGGCLLVSEPPGSVGDRWPADGLIAVGLRLVGVVDGIAVLEQVGECPSRLPRRAGIPAKRPLFTGQPGADPPPR